MDDERLLHLSLERILRASMHMVENKRWRHCY